MTLLERFQVVSEPNNLVMELLRMSQEPGIHIREIRADWVEYLTVDYVPYLEMNNDDYPQSTTYLGWDPDEENWYIYDGK